MTPEQLKEHIDDRIDELDKRIDDRISTIEHLINTGVRANRRDNRILLWLLCGVAIALFSISWEIKLSWVTAKFEAENVEKIINLAQTLGLASVVPASVYTALQIRKKK